MVSRVDDDPVNRYLRLPSSVLDRKLPSSWEKIQCIWDLVVEVGFKEISSVFINAFNYFVSLINPNPYGLNPKKITLTDTSNKVARVVILLHGVGGGPFCFFPLAKMLQSREVSNVFTVKLKPTDRDPLPTGQIKEKIENIAKKAFEQGAEKVEVSMIGHSLGALTASKYIWRGRHAFPNVEMKMMISVAGRLRYIANKFSWFCKDVKDEIETTYQEIKKDPDKVLLYTVSGGRDGLVPAKSVHILRDENRQFIAKGSGHGGVICANSAMNKITEWTRNWALA